MNIRFQFLAGAADRNLSRSGMTLVEVMLGMLILAILAIAATTSVRYPRFMVVSSAHKQGAIHAANEALEEAVSVPYVNLQAGTVSLDDLGARYRMDGRAVSGTRRVDALGEGATEHKRITVSVNYPGGDAPIVLETLITP